MPTKQLALEDVVWYDDNHGRVTALPLYSGPARHVAVKWTETGAQSVVAVSDLMTDAERIVFEADLAAEKTSEGEKN